MTKGANHIPEQVVGERAGRLDALLFEDDRIGFVGADPDRQETIPCGFAEQQHRLVGRLLDPDADDLNLCHVRPPPPRVTADSRRQMSLVLSGRARRVRPT